MLKNKEFDFIKNLKKYFIISGVVFLIGIIMCVAFGPVLDISFSGGTKIVYSYKGDIDTDKVASVTADSTGRKVNVTTSSGINDSSKKLTISLADKKSLDTSAIDKLDKALTSDKALSKYKMKQAEVNSVNPTVGSIFFMKCLVAVLIAAVFVIIYVAIRFRKIGGLSAGVTAMAALIHDILIAFFVTVIFRLNIDSNFIAVVMTLLGYSLNNTIVVFDRVRENRRNLGTTKFTLDEIVNKSNNQVLGRNIMTTVTTFMAILIVLIVCEIKGITALRSLTIPLCFGLVSGAYSSICIAPALWVKWQDRIAKKKLEAKKNGTAKKSK